MHFQKQIVCIYFRMRDHDIVFVQIHLKQVEKRFAVFSRELNRKIFR